MVCVLLIRGLCYSLVSGLVVMTIWRVNFRYKMARVSKRTKRLALSRKKTFLYLSMLKFKLPFSMKVYLAKKILENCKKRKCYTRKTCTRSRERSKHWSERDLIEMDDKEFQANFRLSRQAFEKLSKTLHPLIRKEETFAKNTVPT